LALVQKQTTQLDDRAKLLYQWLKSQLTVKILSFELITGDASFRRSFRLKHRQSSYIAVDAPPKHENNPAFVGIAAGLKQAGLTVPEVFAADIEKGFMLLSDLGDTQLLSVLNAANVDSWYQQAMQQLIPLQQCQSFPNYTLPEFDRSLLMQELELMPKWFIKEHLSIQMSDAENQLLDNLFNRLCDLALSQPQVTTHRDFHSRNLMIGPSRQLAIIDFQDAAKGAISYDLMSLIKDCYIKWPQTQVDGWLRYFYQLLQQAEIENLPTIEAFTFVADAMALQRHLKVVGIFARLYRRDGKPQYLDDIPLTLDYILETCARYSEFNAFGKWMSEAVVPIFNQQQINFKEQL